MKGRNINEFPKGYIKTENNGTQRIWLNGAFIHYEPMTKEECISLIRTSIRTNSNELWKILTFNLSQNGKPTSLASTT